MPIGGALDAVPIDAAIFVDIAQPRHLGIFLVAIADERMDARRAEAAAEGGDVAGAEMLVAEHQDRMLGEGLADPGEGGVVELR